MLLSLYSLVMTFIALILYSMLTNRTAQLTAVTLHRDFLARGGQPDPTAPSIGPDARAPESLTAIEGRSHQ